MIENKILKELKNGSEEAFTLLYNRYCDKVYRFAQLYITSLIEVEEIVQDVFVRLWETRSSIDEDKNIEGFLFILTRNLIFNHTRKHYNETAFKMLYLKALENVTVSIEDELEASDLKAYIDNLISLLPERRREIFCLSRKSHLTNKEIAQRCSITEKAVERHINLSLRFLKQNILLFILFIY